MFTDRGATAARTKVEKKKFRIQVEFLEFGTDFHCSWIYSNPLEIEINLRFLICNIVI